MKHKHESELEIIVDETLPGLIRGEISLNDVLAAHPEHAAALEPLLQSAMWMQARQPGPGVRPGYLLASRQRLVTAIARRPLTAWQSFWRLPTPQRFAVQSVTYILLAFSLVMVVNSLTLAARLSIPGDLLYPAKLGIEAIQLAITLDPQADARLQIEFTQRRTSEIVQLVLEDDYLHLPATVNRLDVQISRALENIDTLEAQDAAQAAEMARSMERMLTNEAFIMSLLRETDPAFTYAGLNQAIETTTRGLTALQD